MDTPTESMETDTPTESMETDTPTESMETDTPTESSMETDTPTESSMETDTPTESSMGGSTTTITVGPGGSLSFDPSDVTVSVGDTIRWEWDSSNHNVVPNDIPDGSSWEGEPQLQDPGATHSHTFEVAGDYSYYCEPHRGLGMTATFTVES